MNIKIDDLMAHHVITAQPHHSVDHVRGMMETNHISAVPVVGPDNEPVGIITATDLAHDIKGASPISALMTRKVFRVPRYNDASVAARIMRKHHIHHVVVTHEQQIVGVISSFDLLALVEEHRFVMKNPPTPKKGHEPA